MLRSFWFLFFSFLFFIPFVILALLLRSVAVITKMRGHIVEERVAPVAYQVILEPGIGPFREFKPPRVHTTCKFVGTFCCAQTDLRKARERELATLDEKLTSSGTAEPYARYKLKSRTGGKKGRHL